MNDTHAMFEKAIEAAKSLPERPDNDTLLKLYALFKQGSSGDVSGDKPGFFDFVGVAKYESWEKLRGTSVADAQSRYIELVRKLGGEI
jgi:acyl-CoA-binding protein